MANFVANLWYDKEADEAVELYTSVFKNSEILHRHNLGETPSGEETIMYDFRLENVWFTAINGGPQFKLNPSISIMYLCESRELLEQIYRELSVDGEDLMPLDTYDFSEYYVWFQDKYGLNWQLMLMEEFDGDGRMSINLLFADELCGLSEDALHFYNEVFEESEIGLLSRYPEGMEGIDPRAKLNYSELILDDIMLVLSDHGVGGDFKFNEAFSLGLLCGTQEEIDYYWNALSNVPEAEECGWLKDKFGVSWQIAPCDLNTWLTTGSEASKERVKEVMLNAKKFVIEDFEEVLDD